MLPKNFLKTLATQVGVSDNEFEVLSRVVNGERMADISKQLGVQANALQKRLGEVYKKFDISGDGPGKLAKLQQILISEYQKNNTATTQVEAEPSHEVKPERVPVAIPLENEKFSWVSYFYGRKFELKILSQWVLEEQCRVIFIQGMGGIGKTTLVKKWISQINPHFEQVIWRNLRDTPSIETLLSEWLEPKARDLSTQCRYNFNPLLQVLSSSKYLLILDEVEAVFGRKAQEGYVELLTTVSQTSIKSCLILMGWEVPPEVYTLAHENSWVKILELNGLEDDAAQQMISSWGDFAGLGIDLLTELIYLYAGNPLVLKIILEEYRLLDHKNSTQFVPENVIRLNRTLQQVLKQQFSHLSEMENYVLESLLVKRKPTTLQELQASILIPGDLSELQNSIQSLLLQSLMTTPSTSDIQTLTLSSKLQQQIFHQLLGKYFNKLGHRQYMEGDFKSAKSNLLEAVRYAPELAEAQYNLGSTYEQLEDVPAARLHYQRAFNSQNKAAYAALNNLARLEILSGHFSTAVDLITPVLDSVQNPIIKSAFSKNLGWAYYLQNQLELAIKYLQQSLEIDFKNIAAHCLMAQVLEAQENLEEALVYWQNCLELDQQIQQLKAMPWKLPELEIWKLTAHQRLAAKN